MLRFRNVFYTISKLSHCPAKVFLWKDCSYCPNFVSLLLHLHFHLALSVLFPLWSYELDWVGLGLGLGSLCGAIVWALLCDCGAIVWALLLCEHCFAVIIKKIALTISVLVGLLEHLLDLVRWKVLEHFNSQVHSFGFNWFQLVSTGSTGSVKSFRSF